MASDRSGSAQVSRAAISPSVSADPARDFSSLPYALHHAYGEKALPYLETMLAPPAPVWVQVNSARALMLAGRPAGFLFAAAFIARQAPQRAELIRFLRDYFPETRSLPEIEIPGYLLRTRAAAASPSLP